MSRARPVAVDHPVALKRLGAGRQPGRVDAGRLAQMLALGTVPAVWVPPAEIRAIRALLPQAAACGRTATAWKDRAKNLLLRLDWTVPRSPTVAAWLAEPGQELDRDIQFLVTSALALAQQDEWTAAPRRSCSRTSRATLQPLTKTAWTQQTVGA